jgi:hypothetical protein
MKSNNLCIYVLSTVSINQQGYSHTHRHSQTRSQTQTQSPTPLSSTPKRLKIGTATLTLVKAPAGGQLPTATTPITRSKRQLYTRKVDRIANLTHRPRDRRVSFELHSSLRSLNQAQLQFAIEACVALHVVSNFRSNIAARHHATQPANTTVARSMAEPTRKFNGPERNPTQIAWLVFAARQSGPRRVATTLNKPTSTATPRQLRLNTILARQSKTTREPSTRWCSLDSFRV